MPPKPSLELRFYRFAMIILTGGLLGIASYLANTTVNTMAELPGIRQQLVTLNRNLDKLEDLPLKVQETRQKAEELEKRIMWLEARNRR